ncbi:MAG: general secretion pathway protein GspK [Kiritimatiellae bacterium]|nr:general secretion pathway protein GspK [Kiritimatiellia bacterium]
MKEDHRRRNGRRHSRRRRKQKKLKMLLLIVGSLGLAIGAGACVAAVWSRNTKLLLLGGVYGACGSMLLFIRWVLLRLEAYVNSRRRRSRPVPFAMPASADSASSGAASGYGAERPAEGAAGSNGERGMVLPMVLVLLALLIGVTVEAQLTAHRALRQARRNLLLTRLRLAAEDGAWQGVRLLAEDESPSFDHAGEAWTRPVETLSPDGIRTRTVILDEDRCFDLNNLARTAGIGAEYGAPRTAAALLTLCGQADAASQVQSILTHAQRNGPLLSWADLLRLPGFSKQMFGAEGTGGGGPYDVPPGACLTVVPVEADRGLPVNVNTAHPNVLLALLGAERRSAVQRLVERRRQQPFQSLGEVADALAWPALRSGRFPLEVRSAFFAVCATAGAEGLSRQVRAVVQRHAQGRMTVLRWAQD